MTSGTSAHTGGRADSEEARFQQLAADVVGDLFVLVKLALVHKMDNEAVNPALERFRSSVETYQEEISPEAAVQFVGDALYFNKRLVRTDLSTYHKSAFLKKFFARMTVSEITFHRPVDPDGVRAFLQAVREASMDPSRVERLNEQSFAGIGFRDLDVRQTDKGEALVVPDNLRVLRSYGILVITIRELLDQLHSGGKPSLLPVRRAMQDFVRLPGHVRSLQLGLLSLEQYRHEPAGRLTNVGITTAMMASYLGMRTSETRDLGVAAVLALVGRTARDELVWADPDQVGEANGFRVGIRRLMRSSGHGRAVSLRTIAAYEQSTAEGRRTGHPLSRLVACADRYDLLTQRPPRGDGMRPDIALRHLLDREDLDRGAARVLVSTLGLFPVGSTVRLDTGELAIVTNLSRDPNHAARPRVTIVADPQGNPTHQRNVDLAEIHVSIAGTVRASEIDLNVGHFLFA